MVEDCKAHVGIVKKLNQIGTEQVLKVKTTSQFHIPREKLMYVGKTYHE